METVSSTAQLAIIAGIFGAMNAIIAAVVVYVTAAQSARIAKDAREDARMARSAEILAATKVEKVAVATEEVKQTLVSTTAIADRKLDYIAKTAEDTHTLVNANMGIALGVNMDVTRRLAELTRGTVNGAADEVAANKAEEMYRAHESKQATVDAQAGKPMPVRIVAEEPVKVTVVEPKV